MKTNQKEVLNPEIQKVKKCMHGLRDLRMFKRYQTVLMYLKGRKYTEIADVIGCTEQTVYNYIRAYKSCRIRRLGPRAVSWASPTTNRRTRTRALQLNR